MTWIVDAAATPRASANPRYRVDIQATYTADGNPELGASFYPNDKPDEPSWSICRPPDTRVCFHTHRKGILTPGATARGTVFQANARFRGRTYSARTATWQGTVKAISVPYLTGAARYRARVIPHGASWTGGWKPDPNYKPSPFAISSAGHGPDGDIVTVEACRNRNATRCVTVNLDKVIVGSWLTGQYLFAFDQRYAADTAFPAVGYGPIAPPVPVSATVARSSPVGPVIGPPAPTVQILHRAIRHGGLILVARISCPAGCHVALAVDNEFGNHSSEASRTVRGSALVGVPRRGLHPGLLDILLQVGDYPSELHGTSRLR